MVEVWTELTGNAFNSIVRAVTNVVNDHLGFI